MAPVLVSPPQTTEKMGETAILGDSDCCNQGLLPVQDANLAITGTVQSLSFYAITADGNLTLGIYDSSGANGGPGRLLASTATFAPVAGWNTQAVLVPVSLLSGNYWLAYLPTSNSLTFPVERAYGTCSWANSTTMTGTYPPIVGTDPCHWSMYATVSIP